MPFDIYGLRLLWLPFTGAILGVAIAVVAMRKLWQANIRTNLFAFALYALTFLTWGFVDIHYGNCQHYTCDLTGRFSSRQYFYTWWFLPERWIPRHRPSRQQVSLPRPNEASAQFRQIRQSTLFETAKTA